MKKFKVVVQLKDGGEVYQDGLLSIEAAKAHAWRCIKEGAACDLPELPTPDGALEGVWVAYPPYAIDRVIVVDYEEDEKK